ncbi:hypothetical protein SteCoe_553 [Stentor coeruleus]|uniref:HECT-type E3 ubiquitin transferase n=1 Tax=Stentor coeruleus TaxID=5963 RepID=A0A1R2D401_9CILI|nr:hypothetical protein SteCoe_553 [Stentor coeruleus]
MKKPRHVPKNESSEEDFKVSVYENAGHTNSSLPGLTKFFISLDSGDEIEIEQSLNIFSSELSLTEEQILVSQPLDKALTLLLECLNLKSSQVQVLSMTCINLILDTLPELSETIVKYRGIHKICKKISSSGIIELGEQSVRALEKISYEFPLETLEAQVVECLLTVIDYFEMEIQKKMLNILSNAIKALETLEIAERHVLPHIPLILGLIKNPGANEFCVKKTLEFLTIFVENLIIILPHRGDTFKPYCKALVEYGVIRVLLDIFPKHAELVLQLLYSLCERSSIAVKNFFMVGGFDVIKDSVLNNSLKDGGAFEGVLNLMDSLVPRMPPSEPWNKEKVEFYKVHPEYMQAFCELILPRTTAIYENFLSKEDKAIMISILEKVLKIANIELIGHHLTCQSFSTFLSELMISKNIFTVRAALRISLTLYTKIPQKISVNFSREGVISRISALKEPDRLKEFKKLPNKKFAGNLEDLLLKVNITKNPYQIESMLNSMKTKLKPATLEDNKKELIAYSKKILDKHKQFENKKAPRIGKEIKMISQKLANCFGDSALEILKKIITLLNSAEKLSFYEISNSSIADSLWKWLADSPTEKLLIRLTEFLKLFTRDSVHNETFLSLLVKYLIGTANFVQHFRIFLHDKKILNAKRSNKIKIIMEYCGNAGSDKGLRDDSLRTRHMLFSTHNKLQFTTYQLISLDKIKELLLRISNETDLYMLVHQKCITETTVHTFLDKPYAHDLTVVVYNGNKECQRGTTILNLAYKKSLLQLRWKFIRRVGADLPFIFLKSPQEIIENIVQESVNIGLDPKDKSYTYFRMVKFLYMVSEYLPDLNYLLNLPGNNPLPLSTFTSTKLSALLSRQLQDVISTEGNTPAQWIKQLPHKCKFLFTPASRLEFMNCFGFSTKSKADKKHKCLVSRDKILEDAMIILQDTGQCIETMLEIEYQNEVGTGLGPTVEFFALVSNEIKKLKIWRNMCEFSGLFPSPISESDENWEGYFEFIGKFIAKALIDGRYIDFQLSPALWKLVFCQSLTVIDLKLIDKHMGRHFIDLLNNPKLVNNAELTFTLPGYYSIELKNAGSSILVTSENTQEFINLASELSLNANLQAKALRKGLETILSIDSLSVLFSSEIEEALCGEQSSDWDLNTLKQAILPSHGYTQNSKTFINLLVAMSKFDGGQKKCFLEFVTGFPRLPLGGFEKLQPKISVVKKDCDWDVDKNLPSVMTCQNYLKIPDYSSYEVLESNLLYAIQEGRQAFHLS